VPADVGDGEDLAAMEKTGELVLANAGVGREIVVTTAHPPRLPWGDFDNNGGRDTTSA
jgi:hypothetical protein